MTAKPRIVSNFNFRIMAAYLRFRERFRKPEETLKLIGIDEEHKLLDFGCGIGSYSIPAARMVGESGLVFALDVHPLAIAKVKKRIEQEHLTNVRTIQSDLETGLEDGSLDHVLLLDVYTWIPSKEKLLEELHRVLKPEGNLAVLIDHMDPSEFVDDIERTGFFTIETRESNFFILRKK
ncbi:MAG: class I SAM-dependent methyltransferase [Promethearchaeota archaeon]